MNIKHTLYISLAVHAGLLAGFSLKTPSTYTGNERGNGLMDITLVAAPQTKTVNMQAMPVKNTLSNEDITIEEKIENLAQGSDFSGTGRDSINYSESGGSKEISDDYFTRVRAKIIKNLQYPKLSRLKNEEGNVKVSFCIDKNGHLVDLTVLEKCGSEALNEAAVQTISKAAPFEPFPTTMQEESLRLNIPLKYELR